MVRSGFAGADRGIFNQNVVFAGDLFQLIEEIRGFRFIF